MKNAIWNYQQGKFRWTMQINDVVTAVVSYERGVHVPLIEYRRESPVPYVADFGVRMVELFDAQRFFNRPSVVETIEYLTKSIKASR